MEWFWAIVIVVILIALAKPRTPGLPRRLRPRPPDSGEAQVRRLRLVLGDRACGPRHVPDVALPRADGLLPASLRDMDDGAEDPCEVQEDSPPRSEDERMTLADRLARWALKRGYVRVYLSHDGHSILPLQRAITVGDKLDILDGDTSIARLQIFPDGSIGLSTFSRP